MVDGLLLSLSKSKLVSADQNKKRQSISTCHGIKFHQPVEIHLVHLGVKRLDELVSVVEKNGEIGERGFHWEHLGETDDLISNLIQHAFHSCSNTHRHRESLQIKHIYCSSGR